MPEARRMLYIRISLMTPKDGCDRDVAQLMDDLMAFYEKQAGFVHGHKLRSADGNRLIGRVTVWESEQAADSVAQTTHVLARRSDLQPLIEADSHIERSFDATEATQSLVDIVAYAK
jgi:quinol monooxygenase YgiN